VSELPGTASYSRQPEDWYRLLGIPRLATAEEIAEAVERLSRQSSALANTAPERSQHLRENVRAIRRDLLSGDLARKAYDDALAPIQPEMPSEQVEDALQNGMPPQGMGNVNVPRILDIGGRILEFFTTSGTCPRCGERGSANAKFCARCGFVLRSGGSSAASLVCQSCGTVVKPIDHFCGRCGKPLEID